MTLVELLCVEENEEQTATNNLQYIGLDSALVYDDSGGGQE